MNQSFLEMIYYYDLAFEQGDILQSHVAKCSEHHIGEYTSDWNCVEVEDIRECFFLSIMFLNFFILNRVCVIPGQYIYNVDYDWVFNVSS